MQLYAGLDLHSRNTYIGIMDKEFKRVFGKRVVAARVYCSLRPGQLRDDRISIAANPST